MVAKSAIRYPTTLYRVPTLLQITVMASCHNQSVQRYCSTGSGTRVKVPHLSDFHLVPRFAVGFEAIYTIIFLCRSK
jgi:hypothetical protein